MGQNLLLAIDFLSIMKQFNFSINYVCCFVMSGNVLLEIIGTIS